MEASGSDPELSEGTVWVQLQVLMNLEGFLLETSASRGSGSGEFCQIS